MRESRTLLALVLLFLSSACSGRTTAPAQYPAVSVAVLAFRNITDDTALDWLGYGFAETLSTKLANVRSIELVERIRLSEVMAELKLQSTAVVDPKTAARLGQIVGAKYVMIGSFQQSGPLLKADARLIDVATSVATHGVDIEGEAAKVFDLQTELAERVVAKLAVRPSPDEADAIGTRETTSLAAYEWKARGDRDSLLGDLAKAVGCYTRAIELDPTYASAFLNRGDAHRKKGDYDRAVNDYGKALELDPKSIAPYLARGWAHFDRRDYDRAAADFSSAHLLYPKHSGALYGRATAWLEKGDVDRAITDYDRALEINPRRSAAHNNRGNAYQAKGKPDLALADYDVALAIDPTSAEAYNNRGVCHASQERWDEAIADYNRALSIAPDRADFYFNRGNAYASKGEFSRAIQEYDRALSINPSHALFHYNKARACDHAGLRSAALAAYRRFSELGPAAYARELARARERIAELASD